MKARGKPGPTSMDTRLGLRLRTRRVTLRMSQTELAAAVGVTFQQTQKYEAALNRVSPNALQKMAAKLEVPIAYFFDAPDEHVQGNDFEAVTKLLATPDDFALLTAFQRIKSKALRRGVVRLVERMGGEH
jgi:transcriptional regulator with XRE-family HTH domain